MSENHEDPVDERLRGLARGYNRPPEPPRDAMWAQIQTTRREQREQAHRSRFGRVLPASAAAWAGWVAALAAMLVVGIGLGRLTSGRQATSQSPLAGAADTSAAASRLASAPPVGSPAGAADQASSARRPAGTPRVVATGSPAGTPAVSRAGNTAADRRLGNRLPADNRVASVYRLAAAQTFSQADALLTSLRADPPADTAAMHRLSRWAREVLSSTRLLMDSPAGRDPATTRLLGDLELVLVQVVQLSNENDDPAARKLIEDAVRRHDVLPRIRSVVGSGMAVAGT